MGNCFSCILPTSAGSNGGSARVIFPKGVTKKFKSVMSVAELMLDAPNHFIVNAAGMVIGQQLSPLTADDELEMGNLYVMLPMTRLNSIVTAGDMGLLLMDATHGKRVVVPEEEDLCYYRMNRRRSRKPILETIAEDKGIQEPGDASAPAVQEPGALEVAPDTKDRAGARAWST